LAENIGDDDLLIAFLVRWKKRGVGNQEIPSGQGVLEFEGGRKKTSFI